MDFHHNSPWKPNQQHAAIMLASGATVVAAAKKLRLNKRTIYYWLTDDEFKRYVNKLRGALMDESMGIIASITTKAARTLDKLLDNPEPAVQLKAANSIFDTAFKMREHVEFDQRIAAVEGRHGLDPEIAPRTGGEANGDGGISDDEFADLFPAKPNDDDERMGSRLRVDRGNGRKPGRNGHAGGNTTVP